MFPNIQHLIAQDFTRLMESDGSPAEKITVHWDKVIGERPLNYDPLNEYTHTNKIEAQSKEVDGIVHYPSAGSQTYHRFAGIENLDLIIDLLAEVDLNGDNLRFEVHGEFYVQKVAGRKLAGNYDVSHKSGPVFRTLYLSKAQ